MAHYIVGCIAEPDYAAHCAIVSRNWPGRRMPRTYVDWLREYQGKLADRRLNYHTIRVVRAEPQAFQRFCAEHTLRDPETALTVFAIQQAADEDSGRGVKKSA